MATKRLQGFLRDPLSEYAQHDLWRFTHLTTTGEVVKGSQSIRRIGADGSYDFLLRFGRVLIESKDRLSQRWVLHGEYTINSQTTATTIPALLLATTPVTSEIVQQLEALLAETELARDQVLDALGDGDFLYHNKNAVGPVSQSEGVNTGAIIQEGSNVNGSFTRFAGGRQITTGTVSGTAGSPIQEGSLFLSGNNYQPTYAIAFTSVESVNVTVGRADGDNFGYGALPIFQEGSITSLPTTTVPLFKIASTKTWGSLTLRARFIAIGRWHS